MCLPSNCIHTYVCMYAYSFEDMPAVSCLKFTCHRCITNTQHSVTIDHQMSMEMLCQPSIKRTVRIMTFDETRKAQQQQIIT